MAGPTRQRLGSGTSYRHREGPKWSRGESKEREPSGVWRWKAASVWCLGSGERVGFPGKEAENKGHISSCGQPHDPVLRTTNMNCDCFYPSISVTWRPGIPADVIWKQTPKLPVFYVGTAGLGVPRHGHLPFGCEEGGDLVLLWPIAHPHSISRDKGC